MSVKVKIGMETIDVGLNIPDANVILSEAVGAPVAKDRSADRIVIPYKVSTNFRSPSHEYWLKHLIYDSPKAHMDIQYSGVYENNDIERERKERGFYYDGTYLSKNARPNGAFVFAIAYSDKHKQKLKKMADDDGIDINKIITVEYGNYFTPTEHVHGNRWLAAIIGAMFVDTVYIPNTIEFWGELDRSGKLYNDGANWISRYYKRKVNIINPVKKTKTEMRDFLKKYPVCACGECMECYTSHIITSGEIPMAGNIDSLRKKIETAARMGKAEEYLPFV